MRKDQVPKTVLPDIHPALASHVSDTPFALSNTSMTAPPRGASPNFYLSYLYTNGIPVLTLHDGVQAQLQLAANRSQLSNFQLESHFGRYRHKYEYLVPTLKFVSSSTFFTNFLQPLSWEELEAREGSLGSSYHSDLLDLLFAFLSTMDAVPTPHFPASPEALTAVLVQGCHRPPGTLTGLFHSQIEPHETPHQYYQRIFIFSLRFPPPVFAPPANPSPPGPP